jgi:Protein of unknown function (DUF3048) N-terminal domain/Protein of unknown function (DUF3048) C-terminal domain
MPLTAPVPMDRTALVVQIENNPIGRPTRNLTNADVVIEATVEGDVTRYSAVFYCQPTVGLTGPIRSARYYNVDLWQQMHVLTVAFGVAHGVQARFDRFGMPELNGLRGYPRFFRRSGSAPAPHNLYGDIEAVRAATTAGGNATTLARRAGTLRPPFAISPDADPTGGRAVHSVTIKTNGFWTFGWVWKAATGVWQRTEAGVATSDAATGKPITATSVVVQRMTETVLYGDNDPGGFPRHDLHLVGLGSGTLFVGGRAIPVKWSRASASAVTTWTYTDGTPMVLPPGRIWWELIPTPAKVTTS